MKKIIAILLAAATLSLGFAGCNGGSTTSSADAESKTTTSATESKETESKADTSIKGEVSLSGSSALLPLVQNAVEPFKAIYKDISVTPNGGGSGTGLKQVADGTVDIGNSDVFAEEKLDADKAKELVDHKVCVVGMAAIVNNDLASTVKDLTQDQLIDIFTGKTKNWSEVGGPDEKVLLVTRPESSGTRALFTEFALKGNSESKDASYLETDNSGELLQTVKDNKGAIGYVALSYLVANKDVTALSIGGVAPTLDNIYEGKYPVWGYEHMYTKGEGSQAAKTFIDFMMSEDFGKSLEGLGYGVTAKMKVTK